MAGTKQRSATAGVSATSSLTVGRLSQLWLHIAVPSAWGGDHWALRPGPGMLWSEDAISVCYSLWDGKEWWEIWRENPVQRVVLMCLGVKAGGGGLRPPQGLWEFALKSLIAQAWFPTALSLELQGLCHSDQTGLPVLRRCGSRRGPGTVEKKGCLSHKAKGWH